MFYKIINAYKCRGLVHTGSYQNAMDLYNNAPDEIKKRSVEELTKISELKKQVQLLRAKRSRLETKLNRLEINLNVDAVPFQADFQEQSKCRIL